MKLKHRHIISIILLLCGLLGFTSCNKESFKLSREEGEEKDNSVFLTFHADVAGGFSRAGEGEEGADEKIRQLLIVIVSKEPGNDGKWVVEHNRLVKGASTGIPLTDGYAFKVEAGRQKRIYLIANHRNLKDTGGNPFDFTNPAFLPDESGKVPVEAYVFKPDYKPGDDGIPMTAVYDITVPDRENITNDEYELGYTLYVVRAATKFSFNFINKSAQRTISVTGIDIESVITDPMYLMPHVNKNAGGHYWVVDHEEASNLTGKDWIDWMVEEAEKTETAQYQWLTDYEVPTEATPEKVSHEFAPSLEMAAMTGNMPSVAAADAIYLPESKTVKSGADNTLGLQEYNVTIHTTENSGYQSTKAIYTSTLPRLGSLFRNTHVKVNIVFNDYTLEWQVDVEPYWGVTLDPIFGLDDPKEETNESEKSQQI
ncbi:MULTISPECIES: hypothetical protein [Butyricimonas]|uniref:hypothetical protein n=1 Tax=Butyricimonas TaxID=574697 RepID=UPI0007FB5229|nr:MULTISPECIES: hypothetical protein [Butyricimonas]